MTRPTLAVLGGTGDLGTGLARRWVQAGYAVTIGSRSKERAVQAMESLREVMEERGSRFSNIRAATNTEAAKAADICVLTVPFTHQAGILNELRHVLKDKLLIDATVPLMPPKIGVVNLPAEGSAALLARGILDSSTRLVSAFQNVAAVHLRKDKPLQCDVLVCGDDREACDQVITLIADLGMRGLYAGNLANTVASEALTSVLITLNRLHKCHAGIYITGIDDDQKR